MPDKLLQQSAEIRSDFFEKQGALLEKLAQEGQSPEALFIGCSDSRVTPETLLGAKPGDLFMLRNVANIFPPYTQTEIGIVAVLEYAVQHLRVSHVIICGHTDCGGIRSLDQQIDMAQTPALARWLDLARPAKQAVDFGGSDLTPEARHLAIVERNVVQQIRHVSSYPFVRAALEADELELHGWVYHLDKQRISYYEPEGDSFQFI